MQSELSDRMAAAARDLEHELDWPTTLGLAVGLAVQEVAGADAAAISVVHAKRTVTVEAATDHLASAADAAQHEVKQGPCLDAIWVEPFVHSPDLDRDPRWPTWGPRVVAQTGVRSLMAFRLFTHTDTLGALNLYSRSTNGFTVDDHLTGLALAAHIAIAAAAARDVDDLSTALASRTTISQAVGILMERFALTQAVAFAVLTRASSTTNRKLSDIATELCTTGRLPGTVTEQRPPA